MKILIVLPRFPYPLEKGDKLRAYNQIKGLSKTNEIVLFCVSHKKVRQGDIDKLKPYCSAIKVVKPSKLVAYANVVKSFFSIDSLQVGYWNSKKIRASYSRFERKQKPDVVYCQMIRTMEWVAKSEFPKVLDFQDALSKNVERRMYKTKGLFRKILHYEFKMLRSCEYDAFSCFDAFTIISEQDRDAVPHTRNSEIKVLPNGVDTDYFKPQDCESKYDVLFCGNMNYAPNVDAALFLAKEVMPLVWKHRPETTLLLAGANPAVSVRNLQTSKIKVTGWVDDIRECYAQAKIFVAPMQIGSGLQNKLLEAMAMRKPCITSPLANNALGAMDGKQIFEAEVAQDYADYILRLLTDKAEADELAANGYNFVMENYNWDKYSKELENLLEEVKNMDSKTKQSSKKKA